MARERLYTTEAIIVRRRDHGEADRVLTLCTPQGKRVVIAKGVRKTASRKAGHLELFARVRVVVARSRSSWDVVSQAEALDLHASLRDDLFRATYARYVAELYDQFVAEEEGGTALYELLSRTLDYLCQMDVSDPPPPELDLLMRAYEQRLLRLAGFRPEWDFCVGERAEGICGRPVPALGEVSLGLDPERGGVLCPECFWASEGTPWVRPLSPAALRLLRACSREPFSRLRQRPVSRALLTEVEQAMRHYLTYHLEHEVLTDAFLRRLRADRGRTP
ncbi:MAG: DNA repair protein RecO [Thermoflexia bacterium]|nr:MAG: DNA repair protein RecO [Thermoflexia bacterium]